jgi:hypothetical protein
MAMQNMQQIQGGMPGMPMGMNMNMNMNAGMGNMAMQGMHAQGMGGMQGMGGGMPMQGMNMNVNGMNTMAGMSRMPDIQQVMAVSTIISFFHSMKWLICGAEVPIPEAESDGTADTE